MMKTLHTLLLLLLALSSSSLGASITLSSAKDFTDFVGKVNSETDYSGTTVYLDSDITLSGSTEPIGINTTYQFRGVFDGQGHVISNLQISSTSQFAGLFGFSYGMTIRNAVLDSSCSTKSTFIGSNIVCVGGIIGYCNSENDQCIIENIVNMAGVTFSGSISDSRNLCIGGIVGNLYSSNRNAHVKNCVNYGSVTDSGTGSGSSNYAELGGLVGISNGESSSAYSYIQNCINYGTITHSGTSSNLIVGGVIGYGGFTYIENCVSAGKIATQTIASGTSYIGGIVGDFEYNICINYCYYTDDVGVSSLYGHAGSTPTTTETPTSPTGVNPDLVSKLNSNATSCNWDKWLLNANEATVTFKMSDDKELSFSSQVILIPNPVKEGNSFLFWCKDAECTEEFVAESVSGTTTLYAAWVNNIVTFDFDNGTTVNKTFAYNTKIIYPAVKKEGHTLSWSNYHELMPAKNITITAQWTPINYTVIFDFGNGTTVNETFTYNTEIIYPEEEGYTLSWDNYHEFMPAKNITVTAQWTPNNYTVTFDYDNGTTVNETFAYNTEIVYPDVKKEGHTLSWDNYHELMPAKNITITAQWTPINYTVSFNFGNGTTVNETFTYNTEIIYPDVKKEGHALSWDNYHEFMPAGDITVTAQWTPNNYTVTFDANGGNVSETSKIVTFNEKYDNLPEPKKEGHMFLGWFTNETNGTEVTNETIVTTPYNHTLYADWEKVTTQVEIVFSTKDLTEEEIKEIIKQYTRADFDIVKVEGESGETRVIIKFTDTQSAEEFVRKVRESSNTGDNNVKRIEFASEDNNSFSPMLYPALLFNALLL